MIPRIFGLDTQYDPMGGAIFRGDDTKLYLQPGSQREPDDVGVYLLTREWMCRTDLVEQFEPREGDVDFVHRKLEYWTHVVKEDGPVSIITTKFNGFTETRRVGRIKKSTFSTPIQDVTVTMPGGGQLTLSYQAPSVTTRYADAERPSPQEAFAEVPEGECKILEIHGSGTQINSNPDELPLWHELLELAGVISKLHRSDFTRTQQGHIWQVSETVQKILVQESAYIGF